MRMIIANSNKETCLVYSVLDTARGRARGESTCDLFTLFIRDLFQVTLKSESTVFVLDSIFIFF